jgi:hypothetical protein
MGGGEVNESEMCESERGGSEKGDGMECDEVVGGQAKNLRNLRMHNFKMVLA